MGLGFTLLFAVGLQMMLLVATLRFISGWSRGLLKGLLWVG